MDTSPELGRRDMIYYQDVIDMLRWAIDIGQIYILL